MTGQYLHVRLGLEIFLEQSTPTDLQNIDVPPGILATLEVPISGHKAHISRPYLSQNTTEYSLHAPCRYSHFGEAKFPLPWNAIAERIGCTAD